MADINYKSSDRTEQLAAIGVPMLLVVPEGGSLRIFVDIPDVDEQEALVVLAKMGAIILATLRDFGVQEAAAAGALALDASNPEARGEYRLFGQPVTPDDLPQLGRSRLEDN